MSGMEVIGLVLAVLPLVLEGIDAYPAVARFKRANRDRREFARSLHSVQSALRATMIRVFTRIKDLLTLEQRRELSHPNVNGSKFFHVWKEVLRTKPDEIEKAFGHTVDDINLVLADMIMVLNDVVKDTEIKPDAGAELLRGIIQDHEKDKFLMKDLGKRFMYTRSSERRRALIDRMKTNIDLLKDLIQIEDEMKEMGSFEGYLSVSEKSQKHPPLLDEVRKHSLNLYHALCDVWRCSCHQPLSAMLRLDKRGTDNELELRFSLFLTFEHTAHREHFWVFQEIEICLGAPLPPRDPPNAGSRSNIDKKVGFVDIKEKYARSFDTSVLPHVKDICQLLPISSSGQLICRAFLLDEQRILWRAEDRQSCVQIDRKSRCLEDLLSPATDSWHRLDKCTSLGLALNLAYSLLQLYGTPWLPEDWGHRSIYFPTDVEKPYVVINFKDQDGTSQSVQDGLLNPYLVALGIILIELWIGKSFAEWLNENNKPFVPNSITEKARLAEEWLVTREVLRNMPSEYSQIVQSCLHCSFSIVQPTRTLSDGKFRAVVYNDVVRRLEAVYKIFTGSLS
jgi:hypothetical protein